MQKILDMISEKVMSAFEGAGYEALAIVNGSADCNILAATALLNQVLGL